MKSGLDRAEAVVSLIVDELTAAGWPVSRGEVEAAIGRYLVAFRREVARRPETVRALRVAVFDAVIDAEAAGKELSDDLSIMGIVGSALDCKERVSLSLVDLVIAVALDLLDGPDARRVEAPWR